MPAKSCKSVTSTRLSGPAHELVSSNRNQGLLRTSAMLQPPSIRCREVLASHMAHRRPTQRASTRRLSIRAVGRKRRAQPGLPCLTQLPSMSLGWTFRALITCRRKTDSLRMSTTLMTTFSLTVLGRQAQLTSSSRDKALSTSIKTVCRLQHKVTASSHQHQELLDTPLFK